MKGTKEKKETKRMMGSGDGFVIGSSDILMNCWVLCQQGAGEHSHDASVCSF